MTSPTSDPRTRNDARAEVDAGQADRGQRTPRRRHDPAPAVELTLDDALAEAHQAAEAAELSMHTGWRLWAEVELDKLIQSGEVFSADDLRSVVGAPPDGEHVNGVGGLFLRASRAGRIVFAGYSTSRRPEARGRPIRRWRGAT